MKGKRGALRFVSDFSADQNSYTVQWYFLPYSEQGKDGISRYVSLLSEDQDTYTVQRYFSRTHNNQKEN